MTKDRPKVEHGQSDYHSDIGLKLDASSPFDGEK